MATNNSDNYLPTQYNVITGSTSGGINNVAPSATSGVTIVSQGSSSQPVFGTALVAGGGTGITSATAYGPICGGTTTTGALQPITAGTTGQVLQSAGTSALPAFTGVASAGATWVLISSQTVSSVASIVFTSSITSYNTLVLVFSNMSAATNAVQLWIRVSTDGGATYLTTGYLSGFNIASYNSASWTNGNTTSAFVVSGNFTSTATDTGSGIIYLQDVTSGTSISANGMFNLMSSANPFMTGNQGRNTNTGINAIQILFSSGNIKTGTVSLYGIRVS